MAALDQEKGKKMHILIEALSKRKLLSLEWSSIDGDECLAELAYRSSIEMPVEDYITLESAKARVTNKGGYKLVISSLYGSFKRFLLKPEESFEGEDYQVATEEHYLQTRDDEE